MLCGSRDCRGELALFVLDVDEGPAMEERLDDVQIAAAAGEVQAGVPLLGVSQSRWHHRVNAVDVDVGVLVEHVEQLRPVVAHALHQHVPSFLEMMSTAHPNGSQRVDVGSVEEQRNDGRGLAPSLDAQQQCVVSVLGITERIKMYRVLHIHVGNQLLTEQELDGLVAPLLTRQLQYVVSLLCHDEGFTYPHCPSPPR